MGLDSRDYYRPSGFGGFSFFPPVIKNLLVANVAVFFIGMIIENLSFSGVPGWYYLNRYFALNPLTGIDAAQQSYNFQIWQIITYQFMHAGFSHLLFNMFFLWMFGMEIENMMGPRKFLIFYLTCGIGAGVLQLIIPALLAERMGWTVGASGAIYGVMVAYAMYFPDRYLMFWFLIPVKAKYMIAFLVIIEFLSVGNQSLVAHIAHIGGALTGFLLIILDRRKSLNMNNIFRSFKKSSDSFSSRGFGQTFRNKTFHKDNVEDAKFYDITDSKNETITQADIDAILDKISQSGYQNLTDKEKKILFEASKKK